MPPADLSSRRRRRRLVLWLTFWAISFALTHTPVVPGGRFQFDYADTIAHSVLYFVLTLLGGWYLASRGALTPGSVLAWAAIYAAYGVLDEWLQQFVRRSMTLSDWLADVVGVVLASLWLLRSATRAKLSQHAAPPGVTPP